MLARSCPRKYTPYGADASAVGFRSSERVMR